MKPLEKIGIGILADPEPYGILFGIETDELDIAAVKIGGDFHAERLARVKIC